MTANEVVEIVKGSNRWPLADKEKHEVIIHALKSSQPSTDIAAISAGDRTDQSQASGLG
ncbi:hypothetical protein NBG4_250008 [Candidatus Sulfobium mesophilum]|uniref:Uncharacterized protein n=1 Tax=Candidatus Sulfobium mesophilum TaxID=2016548 RepID=A0A2U3QGE0_9BACT|nr:hypothetical protein NBG4_250008 [Candidatus Sulfobium mesophilum]